MNNRPNRSSVAKYFSRINSSDEDGGMAAFCVAAEAYQKYLRAHLHLLPSNVISFLDWIDKTDDRLIHDASLETQLVDSQPNGRVKLRLIPRSEIWAINLEYHGVTYYEYLQTSQIYGEIFARYHEFGIEASEFRHVVFFIGGSISIIAVDFFWSVEQFVRDSLHVASQDTGHV